MDKGKFMNLFQLKTNLMSKRVGFIEIIREKEKDALEASTKVIMNLTIIGLAAAIVGLIVMMVFFFTHLNCFTPITLQFSKWVSSPFIGFAILIMSVKLVVVSVGLTVTILTVKNTTFKDVRLRFIEACKLRLRVLLRRKVQPQAS
ncbi:MAG: hypothetical protein SCARUB_03682 [Candidatus Scalindua rubra]|uniref:Uncharacterized protein n=1 Tax=Candidatus Scalindua rubra TaxID=1872076 RepID=A0A1E3X6J6_9BACT|nr:MAG: hypothetical protein SCARUB_03682 [Candidatus Scalindua rubra]